MSIRFKCDYEWYQFVYLKTDEEQKPWMLVGVLLTPNGPMFSIAQDGEVLDVYEGEFTNDVNTELKLGLENGID